MSKGEKLVTRKKGRVRGWVEAESPGNPPNSWKKMTEEHKHYDPSPRDTSAGRGSPRNPSAGPGRTLLLASGIGVALGAVVVCLIAVWCWRRRLKLKGPKDDDIEIGLTKEGRQYVVSPPHALNATEVTTSPRSSIGVSGMPLLTYGNLRRFTYEEMNDASKGFNVLLGKGGYGPVYKATLSDGTPAAVKRQMKTNGDKEFETEIQLLGRLHHKNLVNLIGFCSDANEKMLVYEYKSKGSLSKILYGKKFKRRGQLLPWHTRINILLDIAEGIDYLHNHAKPAVIHRDIKSSNILLDENYNAFIADFGIGKDGLKSSVIFGTGGQTTAVKGTVGYLDPDYFETKRLTKRSDVYSFGVLMAELVSGLNPAKASTRIGFKVQELNLEDLEAVRSFVDPNLEGEYDMADMIALLELTQHCTRVSTTRRPLMDDVLYVLRRQFSPSPDMQDALPSPPSKQSDPAAEVETATTRLGHQSGMTAGSDIDCDNSSKSFSRRSLLNGVNDSSMESVSFDVRWREVKLPIAGLSTPYQFDGRGGGGGNDDIDGGDSSISFNSPHSGLLTPQASSSATGNRAFEGIGNSENLEESMQRFPWAQSFGVKEGGRGEVPMDRSQESGSGFHFQQQQSVATDVSSSCGSQKQPPLEEEVEMKHLRRDHDEGSDGGVKETRWMVGRQHHVEEG